MQMNGGFFGSMMPQGATSFMPPGASPTSMIAGVGDTPQGMTSPPISQQLLAALAALGKMGGGQQGQAGPAALPPNSFSPFMADGGGQPQAGAPPSGGAPAAGANPLAGLDPNMLKSILARLGIGSGPLSGPTADGLGNH